MLRCYTFRSAFLWSIAAEFQLWKLQVICSTPEGARQTMLKEIHLSSVHYMYERLQKFHGKFLILLKLQIQ